MTTLAALPLPRSYAHFPSIVFPAFRPGKERKPFDRQLTKTNPELTPENVNNAILDREIALTLPASFKLDFATLNEPVTVKARLTGPENAPVVLVLGGISANRNVCATAPESKPEAGWWEAIVGAGRLVDTRCYRVLSFDFLPGDQDLQTQSLPVTTADQARLAATFCDHLGIDTLHAFIGSSYGGMVALSFGVQFPQRVRHIAVVCAAHRPHPMGTAWRSIQRKIVRFGLETGQPERAISLARELGMTTYRTSHEFGERFPAESAANPDERSDVEKYLETRGQAFIGRMSPERYLSLSQSIDCHHIDPSTIQAPVTLIGCRQDQLVPIEEMRLLHQALPQPGQLVEFDSLYGHDAFLKEDDILQQALRPVLEAPVLIS